MLSILAFFLIPSLRSRLSKLIDKNPVSLIAPKKQVIETKKPKPLTEQKVTKKISAKDGGELRLTSKGVEIALFIPPGALANDTEVGLTPLEESPLDNNNPPGPDEGNPPEPPQEPPNQPPEQPPEESPEQPPEEPPEEPPESSPPWIWIDPDIFDRPVFVSYSRPVQMEEVKPDLSSLTNLFGQNQDKTPKPPDTTTTPPGGGGQVLVHIGDGIPDLISTTYFPGGFGGPIKKGGPVGPEKIDPPTAKKILDQAVANGNGACTQEFIDAYVMAVKTAQAAGKTTEAAAYQAVLEKCKDQEVGFLKNLCDTDRRLLRRKDFEDRMLALGKIPDAKTQIDQIEELKKKCIGQYRLNGGGTAPGSGAGVELTSNLESNVCGYVDEEWKGNYRYQLLASSGGGSGQHIYEGKVKFKLPYKGGSFSAQAVGSHSFVINGTPVNISLPDLSFGGSFDGAAGVHLLFVGVSVDTEIVKEADSCEGWGEAWIDETIEPPLAPLPK